MCLCLWETWNLPRPEEPFLSPGIAVTPSTVPPGKSSEPLNTIVLTRNLFQTIVCIDQFLCSSIFKAKNVQVLLKVTDVILLIRNALSTSNSFCS